MRQIPLPVTLVLSPGRSSMEVLGRELAERLETPRLDARRYLGQEEAFSLSPAGAAIRAFREIRLVQALRGLDGVIHFPNQHHARYGLSLRQPYVVTVHHLPNRIERGALELERAGIRHAAAVIAPSEATRRDLVEHLPLDPGRVHVIPPAIDLRRFHRVAPPPLSHPYVLFVGSEQPRKNLGALLEALGLLKRHPRHRTVKLIKVGDAGGSEAPLRRHTISLISSLGLNDDVELVGRVRHQRLLELLSGAACLVQPSWHEGVGLTPLEAMACGCPVIVSDRGALPEMAGPAALVTAPAPEALAAEIDLVLGDSALREGLRLAGLAHVRRFGWSQAVAQTLELYRMVRPEGIPRLRPRAKAAWMARAPTPIAT